jgi:hypothetical protein
MSTQVLTWHAYPATQTWNANDSVAWTQEAVRTIAPPRDVRLHSMGVSGGVSLVNLTPGGQSSISINGGLEVWARIVHPGNIYEYLSGPLSTPVDFTNVIELWLGIGSLIANGACTQVRYDIMANGNIVYELL